MAGALPECTAAARSASKMAAPAEQTKGRGRGRSPARRREAAPSSVGFPSRAARPGDLGSLCETQTNDAAGPARPAGRWRERRRRRRELLMRNARDVRGGAHHSERPP